MKKTNVLFLTQSAAIAALYVILTLIANAMGISNHVIQVRFSESLTILPFFTFAAVPGLFIGCFISNLLTGAIFIDVIFGSIATLLGAIGTYALRKYKWLTPLPPILANTIIIPFILAYAYQFEGGIPFFMLTIGIGEFISCGILGMGLLFILTKHRNTLFPIN